MRRVLVLGAVVALTLCACSPGVHDTTDNRTASTSGSSASAKGKVNKVNYWDGDLPLEERQSVQAFQRDAEPTILAFRNRLAEVGGGSWEARDFGSSISQWDDNSAGFDQKAWELVGQTVAGPYVPVEEVEKIGREFFAELYPEYELGSDKSGVRQLSWSDSANGGFLYVTVHQGKSTYLRYQTGLRPSDETTESPRDFVSGRVEIDIPEE